ncbi:MAG TPA: cation diffusion facilitator family transporter, partial [Pirellulales bacterium]
MPNSPRSDRSGRWPLYREAVRAALLGLAVNFVLGVVKLVAGLATGVFALVADAVNSLGDVVTTLVVLYAFYIAQKPPTAEHPYGHSRAEAIAGSNVAVLLFISALGIGWEAIHQMSHVHPAPPLWTLGIAAANAIIKECLYRYKLAVGQRTGSSALVANAWDHRSDALCATAVFVGLGLVWWGGPSFVAADEIAALVVVGAILWSSVGLFRSSAYELMDVQAEDGLVEKIRATAAATPGVANVEKLLVRKSGLEY